MSKLEAEPERVAEVIAAKTLGRNAWNMQPVLTDTHILGHHPTLEQYDNGNLEDTDES